MLARLAQASAQSKSLPRAKPRGPLPSPRHVRLRREFSHLPRSSNFVIRLLKPCHSERSEESACAPITTVPSSSKPPARPWRAALQRRVSDREKEWASAPQSPPPQRAPKNSSLPLPRPPKPITLSQHLAGHWPCSPRTPI